MKPLTHAKPDETLFVLDLKLEKDEKLHLQGLGIYPEGIITIVKNDNFQPIIVETFGQSRFALDRTLAEGIVISHVLENQELVFKGNQTQQRQVILDMLKSQGHHHFTLEEFTHEVQSVLPSIGQITIYRTLKTLLEKNILEEIDLPDGNRKFELKKSHHDHLICEDCGAIYEFHNDEIESIQEKIAQKYGMTISNHSMILYGKGCQKCR